MLSRGALFAISTGYVAIFLRSRTSAIAAPLLSDRRRGNRAIYSLALCVYCTSWTFYGAVGRAASSGWDFPAYLPWAGAGVRCSGGPLLQRSHPHLQAPQYYVDRRLHRRAIWPSSADCNAGHRNRGCRRPAYIALQLKGVSFGFEVLVGTTCRRATPGRQRADDRTVAGCVRDSVRHARPPSARRAHHGMVLAIAFESLVKLAAFLAVGVYVDVQVAQRHRRRVRAPLALPQMSGAMSDAS